MTVETVVYHDKTYPEGWINRNHSSLIAAHFNQNSFRVLDAVQLREFILDAIDKGISHTKIVVFSQDMVPETVCEEEHSNTLFRQFLDNGGNVIWLGDIPLFYIGVKNAASHAQCRQAWRVGAPVYMLGIVPIFSSTIRSVDFKPLGRILGLRHHWTSARPVLKDETMFSLATSKNIGSDYYINIPPAPTLRNRIWRKLRGIEGSIELPGFGLKIGIPPMEQDDDGNEDTTQMRSRLYETHLAAWIKNYNKDFPLCGFARIWDYIPRSMPQWMLDELLSFANNIEKRIE